MRPRLFNAPHGGVVGCSAVALYAAFEMGRQWGIWWPLLVGGPLLVALVVDTMVRDRRDLRRHRRAVARWRSWTEGEDVNGRWSYRTADNVRGVGGLLVVLSIVVVFGLIASLFELGAWVEVHTWGAVAASLLCGVGGVLGALGDRAARWYSDDARRARGELR